jgi:four helix bundle protein
MNSSDSTPFTYRDLEVWKQSRHLAIRVIQIMSQERQGKGDWALYDQMRRASLSVPSNIAEGDERGTNKDALRFLYISKGSLAEFRTQIDIAYAAGKLGKEEFEELETLAASVARLLGGLIRNRLKRLNLSKPLP